MEQEDEFMTGAYDFGARIYNSKIARWMARDPLESKYPALSTYHFVNNNPVLYVDFDGRDFIVNGSNKDFNKLRKLYKKRFGGKIDLERGKGNKVKLIYVDGTKEQIDKSFNNDEAYKVLLDVVTSSNIDTKIDLYTNVSQIKTGTYRVPLKGFKNQLVDIDDILARSNWGLASGIGGFTHELKEAFEDAKDGKKEHKSSIHRLRLYAVYHAKALISQAKVDGFQSMITIAYRIPGSSESDKIGEVREYFFGRKNKKTGEMEWYMVMAKYPSNGGVPKLMGQYKVHNFQPDRLKGSAKEIYRETFKDIKEKESNGNNGKDLNTYLEKVKSVPSN